LIQITPERTHGLHAQRGQASTVTTDRQNLDEARPRKPAHQPARNALTNIAIADDEHAFATKARW
jgi:hypothetical protein